MADARQRTDALQTWVSIAGIIEQSLDGLPEEGLDLRGGSEGWSIRETVHHLVEANLVASNIMIAALARSGCTYDWSWVTPDASWMRRVGYDTAPIRPALDALRALCQHIAGLIGGCPDGLRREVRLLDAPGAKLYTKSVEDLLRQEVEHVGEHLRDVAQTRKAQRK